MKMAVRTGQWEAVIARREAHMTPDQKRERIAHLHGKTRAEQWDRLMARWITMLENGYPHKALTDAYRHGYLACNGRMWRRQKKQVA